MEYAGRAFFIFLDDAGLAIVTETPGVDLAIRVDHERMVCSGPDVTDVF